MGKKPAPWEGARNPSFTVQVLIGLARMARAQVMSTTGRSVAGVQTNLRYVSVAADKLFQPGRSVMRALPLALGLALFLLLPSTGPMSLTRQAAAQTSEALVLKCRKAVFRRYGHSGADPSKRYLKKDFVMREVDRCVANGGRIL